MLLKLITQFCYISCVHVLRYYVYGQNFIKTSLRHDGLSYYYYYYYTILAVLFQIDTMYIFVMILGQQPNAAQGRLISEVYRSHTVTHHSR